MLISEEIGLALLVEFGTNTPASLMYFAIPVVANHMRSLGTQTGDGRRHIISDEAILHLLSFVQIHSICLSILVLILINSLRSLSFEINWAHVARRVCYKYTRFSHIFSIPVVANHMSYLGAQTTDGNGRYQIPPVE